VRSAPCDPGVCVLSPLCRSASCAGFSDGALPRRLCGQKPLHVWAHVSNQEHHVSPRGASDWWRESVRKSVSVHEDKIWGSAINVTSTRITMHSHTSDTSASTMGVGLNGGSFETFFFTLSAEQTDILFVEEAVRLSDEQVLIFIPKDSPQDDLWVRMTLLLERSQNQSRR